MQKKERKVLSIPPTYLFLCMLGSAAFYFLVPSMNVLRFPYTVLLGLPVLLFSLYVISAAHFLLKKHDTPETYARSTRVVATGLYRYSRNPMYVGFLLFLTSLSLMLGNALSFIGPLVLFIIIDRMFIPYEEEKMERELGEDYRAYKRTVRRWL